MFVRLVTADVKTRTKLDRERQFNSSNGTHFGGHQSVICCTMNQVENCPKARIVFKVFESDRYT